MNALKPCPFCGEMPEVEPNGDCYCDNYICPMAPDSYMPGDWNTRPIEDDLRKRIAELENEHNVWLIGASNAVKNLEARIAELEAEIDQLTADSTDERQDDKWIPVGERLPECEKDVLVFWGKALDGSKIDWFGTAWRNECDDGKWCTDPIVPTHWMPLPESPNDTQTQTIVYGKESE